MGRRRTILYIVIVALLAAFAYVFLRFGNELFDAGTKVEIRDDLVELKAALQDDDYCLYWVGSVPSRLRELKLEEFDPDNISREDLPFRYGNTLESEVVGEGDDAVLEYTDRMELRDIPEKNVIVIDGVTGLSPETLSLFVDCTAESRTVILVFGKDAVKEVREYFIWPLNNSSSLRYSMVDGAESDPMDASSVTDTDSPEFARAFLEYLQKEVEN